MQAEVLTCYPFSHFTNHFQSQGGTVVASIPPPNCGADYLSPKESMMDKEGDFDSFYKEHAITLKGENIPKPILTFCQMNLPDFINRAILDEKYEKPTPIQSQTWSIALSGKNMVGIAQTGSGKTLGFILPSILNLIKANKAPSSAQPTVLVLAPTRELALQIQAVAAKFAGWKIRSVCIYGGASKYPQRAELRRGVDIVIATPGRLNDFLESNEVDLSKCNYLVLDEADRMLDMGFEPQVRKIINGIDASCQTLMFSATWPKEVKNLAEEFLGDYVQVNIGAITQSPTANHSITQIVEVCQENEKLEKFFKILEGIYAEKGSKTLVFAETKKKVDYLVQEIKKEKYRVVAIHGDKNQRDREWILNAFASGRYQLMVATDVASRGLDLDDIKFVVNFDFPNSSEDYIHRIGRTGRFGKTGTAYTFLTNNNSRHAQDLVNVLQEANQPISEDLHIMATFCGSKRFGNRGYGFGNKRPYIDRGFGQKNFNGKFDQGNKFGQKRKFGDYGNNDKRQKFQGSGPAKFQNYNGNKQDASNQQNQNYHGYNNTNGNKQQFQGFNNNQKFQAYNNNENKQRFQSFNNESKQQHQNTNAGGQTRFQGSSTNNQQSFGGQQKLNYSNSEENKGFQGSNNNQQRFQGYNKFEIKQRFLDGIDGQNKFQGNSNNKDPQRFQGYNKGNGQRFLGFAGENKQTFPPSLTDSKPQF